MMNRLTTSPACKSAIALVVLLCVPKAPVAQAAEIAFSTFLGGSKDDFGHAITPTPDGGFVIVGMTHSPDFPTFRALQSEYSGKHVNGLQNGFVVKLDATGSRIEFATYLGGSGADFVNAVAVDPQGNIYVAGETYSEDFPTVGGVENPRTDSDGFLTKISPDGQEILFSTLLGGTDFESVTAIAYERDGRVFVTGQTSSCDFLGRPSVCSERSNYAGDAFVVSIDTVGSQVVSAALLGGSDIQYATHLKWDRKSRALWVGGATSSSDFPSIRPVRQTSGPVIGTSGGPAGFLARLVVSKGLFRLKSSSILPGQVRGLTIDRRGRPHLTFAKALPLGDVEAHRLAGWEDILDRCPETFYLRVQASGRQLQNVQCLPILVDELAVDRQGRVVIAGQSRLGLPLASPIQTKARDGGFGTGSGDLYVAVLAKGAVQVLFGTYFGGRRSDYVGQDEFSGGLAVSPSGQRIFLTGSTSSIDYQVVDAVQAEKPGTNGRPAAFVTELRPYR